MNTLVIECSCVWLIVFLLVVQGRKYPCSKTPKFDNGIARKRSDGKVMIYKCLKKFYRIGGKFALCSDGKWSDPPPICIRRGCGAVTSTSDLKTKTFYEGAMLKFHCPAGKTRQGPEKIYCNGRNWNADPPRCVDIARRECDFEDKNLCGWSQSLYDNFEWEWHSGRTVTRKTGPRFDHTFMKRNEGHYIYIDASSPRKFGDKAILMSPIYVPQNDVCFMFWYHMYGDGMGSLEVFVKNPKQKIKDLETNVKLNGTQGRDWKRYKFNIGNQDKAFQILLVGTVGETNFGDIAIDDVGLYKCSDLKEGMDNRTTGGLTPKEHGITSSAVKEKITTQSLDVKMTQSTTPWEKTSYDDLTSERDVVAFTSTGHPIQMTLNKVSLETRSWQEQTYYTTMSNKPKHTATSTDRPATAIQTSGQSLFTRETLSQYSPTSIISQETTSEQPVTTVATKQSAPQETTSDQPVTTDATKQSAPQETTLEQPETTVATKQSAPRETTSEQQVSSTINPINPELTSISPDQQTPTTTTSDQPLPTMITTTDQQVPATIAPNKVDLTSSSSSQQTSTRPTSDQHLPTIITTTDEQVPATIAPIQPEFTSISSDQQTSTRTISDQDLPTITTTDKQVPTAIAPIKPELTGSSSGQQKYTITTSDQLVSTITAKNKLELTSTSSGQQILMRTTSDQPFPTKTTANQPVPARIIPYQTVDTRSLSNQPVSRRTTPERPRPTTPVSTQSTEGDQSFATSEAGIYTKIHEYYPEGQLVENDDEEMNGMDDYEEESGSGDDSTSSGMNLEDQDSIGMNNRDDHQSTLEAPIFVTIPRPISREFLRTTLSPYLTGETEHSVNKVYGEDDISSYKTTPIPKLLQSKITRYPIISSDKVPRAPFVTDRHHVPSSQFPTTSVPVSPKVNSINATGDFFFPKGSDASLRETSKVKTKVTPKEKVVSEEVTSVNPFIPREHEKTTPKEKVLTKEDGSETKNLFIPKEHEKTTLTPEENVLRGEDASENPSILKEHETATIISDISGSLDSDSSNSSQSNESNVSFNLNESKVADASTFISLPMVIGMLFSVGLISALIAVAVYFWAKMENREMSKIKRSYSFPL